MNEFNIETRKNGDVQILEINGELDAHTAPDLETSLKELINQGHHRIVVNCRNLEYISSAGLGVFMAYIEDIRAEGGDIKLTNMSSNVYNVFDLLGFPKLYSILDDEEKAVEQFNKEA